MKQLIMAAIAAGVLAVTSMQQSDAQYETYSTGTASPAQLQRCNELGIDRSQCSDITILAKERLLYAQKTTYGNNPEGPGIAIFSGIETFAVIGILGTIFGGIAGVFYIKGGKAKPVPA